MPYTIDTRDRHYNSDFFFWQMVRTGHIRRSGGPVPRPAPHRTSRSKRRLATVVDERAYRGARNADECLALID